MNMRKPALIMAICFFCAGMVWSQTLNKTLSDVYKMDITVATNNLSPETTCMLCIIGYEFGFNYYHTIFSFDGTNNVQWSGTLPTSSTGRPKVLPGVIIQSGVHTLSSDSKKPITFDFKPKTFYSITINSVSGNLTVTDITNNINWSNEKAQMEQVIQQYTNTSSGQTAQGSGGSGIQGALSRAAKTLMGNLKQNEKVAILSFTAPDRDSAQFVQEELEVILVNNRFPVVDRATLDKIRQEQKFQLTGEVDNQTAVAIGKFAGAKVVVTGSISGTGDMRRLRLRALDTETADVLASSSEAF